MKYIVFETPMGMKVPVIFPDVLTHCFVAGAMQMALDTLDPSKDLRPKQCDGLLERAGSPPVSAGFVNLGFDVSVHGVSESLGGLPSNPTDAVRIVSGDAVLSLPDGMLLSLLERLQAIKDPAPSDTDGDPLSGDERGTS